MMMMLSLPRVMPAVVVVVVVAVIVAATVAATAVEEEHDSAHQRTTTHTPGDLGVREEFNLENPHVLTPPSEPPAPSTSAIAFKGRVDLTRQTRARLASSGERVPGEPGPPPPTLPVRRTDATGVSFAQSIFATMAKATLILGAKVCLWTTTLTLMVALSAALLSATFRSALQDLAQYWRVLAFLIHGGDYRSTPYFNDDLHAKTHIQSLALMFFLWDRPHYRNGDFHEDMVKNLRNVAFPGTGLPLSAVARFRPVLYLFVFLGVPALALGYATVTIIAKATAPETPQSSHSPNTSTTNSDSSSDSSSSSHGQVLRSIVTEFRENLLHPGQWFNFWRTNCVLASYHALITGAAGYRLEDKLEFLLDGQAKGIAISPFLEVGGIVCKDRNEEGGMGIHVFKNATQGGRWIIQELIANSPEITPWLPDHAPLSTLRIITASDHAFDIIPPPSPAPSPVPSLSSPTTSHHKRGGGGSDDALLAKVKPLSCVWRAGRENATTDHSSVLFDVDLASGTIGTGTTNAHWYQLGLHKDILSYRPSPHFTDHPDNNVVLSQQTMPHMAAMAQLVCDAHTRMLPDVPLCGWDVALTKEHGICLLEVNLSCNFFNGTFDRQAYFQYVDKFYAALEPHRLASLPTS